MLPGMLPISLPPPLLTSKVKRTPNVYRPTQERPGLDYRLIRWLESEHRIDPFRSVRPTYHILSDTQRAVLVRAHPSKVLTAHDITVLLGETPEWEEEWSSKLCAVLSQFASDYTCISDKPTSIPRKRKK